MKYKILTVLFSFFSVIIYSQNNESIDNTALLLGLLEYPLQKFEETSKYAREYNSVVQVKIQNEFIKNFSLKTIDHIHTTNPKDVEIIQKEQFSWLKSKVISDLLNSYLIFYPDTRKEMVKKKFRKENFKEGYINPYVFSPTQQESFIIGLLISKGKINEYKDYYEELKSGLDSGNHIVAGDYIIGIRKSRVFFDIISSFIENSEQFEIKSSEIKLHNYRYGYENFYGRLSINVKEKYKNYIEEKIKLRDRK